MVPTVPSRTVAPRNSDDRKAAPPYRVESFQVLVEAPLEPREPLAIDERLEDPANLELFGIAAEAPKKSEIDDLVDVRVDDVAGPRVVAGLGEKDPEHLVDLVSAEDEARVGA